MEAAETSLECSQGSSARDDTSGGRGCAAQLDSALISPRAAAAAQQASRCDFPSPRHAVSATRLLCSSLLSSFFLLLADLNFSDVA